MLKKGKKKLNSLNEIKSKNKQTNKNVAKGGKYIVKRCDISGQLH